MPEWPEEILRGIDGPRPLPPETADRLQQALSATHSGPAALDDRLTARLEDTLADPVAPLLEELGAPRPLDPVTRRRLEQALTSPRRRRPPAVVTGMAAGLLVLAGIGVALGTLVGSGTGPSRALPKASAETPLRHVPSSNGAASSSGAASSTAAPSASAGAIAAPAAQPALVPTVAGLDPDTGPAAGGTWVTINGSGLEGTTAVYFGTLRAIFDVVSVNQLRAEAPAHAAGTVDVYVTTPAGTSTASPADHFTYR